ncbi:MAG: UDP-2,3-diacylglucosamine diphosphatase [Candidatus Eisenbacteria sp.]|nr:UDP-2,3-diacylglucosamine diphosphatase [Candidatus Eisenbacteria bacterium]
MTSCHRRVLFFSDAHLGAASPEIEARKKRLLFDFLDYVRDLGADLYIAGDLFDFWFEYRTAVPREHYKVLCRLSGIVDAGSSVTYLGGNHDFWLGGFLETEVGMRVSQTPLTVECQSRRIFLAHGDGLLASKDYGYRLLRRITRARLVRTLFRMIHPDVGIWGADLLSRASRALTRGSRPGVEPEFRAFVRNKIAEGYDAVVVGHHHYPMHVATSREECIVIGDWIDHFTFLELSDGKLTLKCWSESGEPDVLPSSEDYPIRSASRFLRPRG